jgi:hypothetical protein
MSRAAADIIAAEITNKPGEVVAKDGIEPPTRGFSIPCSTN